MTTRVQFWAMALLVASIALPAMALDPERAITQYGLSVWRSPDGLPQGSLNAIAQTPDGYMWFGTPEGLARFDGARFTVFDAKNTAVLADTRHIGALLVSPDGSLWIGKGDGLARYKGGKFTSYPAAALTDAFIWSLAHSKDGSIWVGTYTGGLNRFRNGQFTVAMKGTHSPTGAVWTTHVSRDGAVWAGTNGLGLKRMAHGKTTTFTTGEGLANNIIWAIHQDRSGAMWVGTNGGLNRIDENGRITTFTTANGLSANCVKSILEDRDGNLWIGTEGGGLNRYARGRFTSISVEQGLSDTTVVSLFEDREGSLWAGTTAGLTQLRQDRIVNISRHEGLIGDMVWSIREARDGSLLVAMNDGFTRWKNGEAFNLSTKNGLSSNVVRSVLEDRDGSIWLATNDGLNHWKDGKVRVYRTADGLPHDTIRTLDLDRNGDLWIGTRGGGLARYDGTRFTLVNSSNGLIGDSIASVDEDRDGSLWIATNDGLSIWKDGKSRNYGPKEGLAAFVRTTYHARDGAHWIGTFGEGLFRMKNGRIVRIQMKDGLFDDVVFSILEDEAGFFWMSSNRGVFRVSKQQLDDFADGKRKSVESESFGVLDGMKNAECNGGAPAGWKGSDGRLYFPSSQGVAIFDPKMMHSSSRAAVWIEETVADAEQGNLEVHYTAITFLSPKRLVFRYRLKGFNDAWVEAGRRRTAYFTNIPPGNYTFEVMASTGDGTWHHARNRFDFRVPAAFYETWWFYAICIALVIAAIGAGFRMRLRIAQRREKELVERVQEQTMLLSIANTRKQLILNAAGEGILGLDTQGVATFINPAAARMLGWSVDELVGLDFHALTHEDFAPSRDECSICSATLQPAIRGPRALEFRRRDGTSIPVECTASTIVNEDGSGAGVVLTFRDVTERKAVERMKNEFVSTVSHELRTPLTSIRGALGLLRTGKLGTVGVQGQRMLDIATDNADRLARLVNDILDLERVEGGNMTMSFSAVSAKEILREACNAVEAMAEQAGVLVVQKPTNAVVWVDPDRIGQVITNLLSNAIKFSPRGTTVGVSVIADEKQCTFRFADRGRGVPADKFETIFEPFKQVDASDSRDKGGTGLGLAICKSIVDLHDGRIWVEHNEGGGAVFQFTVASAKRMEATG